MTPDMKLRTMSGKCPSTSRMAAAAAAGSRRSIAATIARCEAMSARTSPAGRRSKPKYQNRMASLCRQMSILPSGGFFDAAASAWWKAISIRTRVRKSRLRITAS